jgi:hypothetical protein
VKYRVVKEYGLFYPQTKGWFVWWSTSEPTSAYHTLEEAIVDIEEHKRIFTKKKTNVVWRSY